MAFYFYHFQMKYFISKDGRETKSLSDLGLPLPVTHTSCPLFLPFQGQTYKPAIITISRIMSYFIMRYELADRRNEKDTVVCDLRRKHQWILGGSSMTLRRS